MKLRYQPRLLMLVSLLWIWVYQSRLRSRLLSWGSPAREINRRMPGDELVPDDELLGARERTKASAPSGTSRPSTA